MPEPKNSGILGFLPFSTIFDIDMTRLILKMRASWETGEGDTETGRRGDKERGRAGASRAGPESSRPTDKHEPPSAKAGIGGEPNERGGQAFSTATHPAPPIGDMARSGKFLEEK
jgi:hypothetical protein